MTDGSQDFDPYRFGRPEPMQPAQPQQAPYAGAPRGKEIMRASWRLLREDKELIALPLLGALARRRRLDAGRWTPAHPRIGAGLRR